MARCRGTVRESSEGTAWGLLLPDHAYITVLSGQLILRINFCMLRCSLIIFINIDIFWLTLNVRIVFLLFRGRIHQQLIHFSVHHGNSFRVLRVTTAHSGVDDAHFECHTSCSLLFSTSHYFFLKTDNRGILCRLSFSPEKQ